MFEAVLKKIKPTQDEELVLSKKVSIFLKNLNKNLKGAKTVLGGSFAKGTWLSGNHDVDIFVVFEKGENISDELERSLKKSFKSVERVHGSRDYFWVREEGLTFEIVPVLKIKKASEAKNVTDVSVLHVDWVKRHSTLELRDQIRLAKKFFRAQKVYGAETYIKGFSGYVTEILVIYYGSFLKLLKHCMHWKKGMVIDLGAHGENLEKYSGSPLILIDPVQPTRNAAAALSEEKFNKFILACRKFVQKPFEKSFEELSVDLKELKEKDVVLQVEPLEGKRDIVGTKMLKVFEELVKELENNGFTIKEKEWSWDEKAYFWFSVKEKVLEKMYKHRGPPIKMKKYVEEFKKKHKGLKLLKEKNYVYILKEREYRDLNECVKKLIKKKSIQCRVKKIKVL